MIRNVAKSFIKRVFSVSHKSFHQDNKEQVKRILAKNNFPVQVVDKLMNEVRDAYKYQHTNREKSYPFLDNTKPQPRIGPAANSTMIATKTVSFKETTVTPKPKYKQNAFGFAGITYIRGISETIRTN